MSSVLEQEIIIVFSLPLREPLVLDLTMLSFISLPYTVFHHDFQFFLLDCFHMRLGNLMIIDVMTGCYGLSFFLGIFIFFFMFSLSLGFMEIPFSRDSTSSFHHQFTNLDGQPGIL
jgi:hypothetical protein